MRQFNEFTFNFFDPTKEECKDRPYYSNARFVIETIGFGVQIIPYLHTEKRVFWKFPGGLFPMKYTVFFRPFPKWILGVLANYFCNRKIKVTIFDDSNKIGGAWSYYNFKNNFISTQTNVIVPDNIFEEKNIPISYLDLMLH